MLFLFYTNTIFSKFMKLNISSSLFKKRISFSHLTQTIMLPLQFLEGKTCMKAVMIISELAKHFCFVFFHFRECYESIGCNHADALVGFHVFTGCGIIRRFLGKSKSLWWKTFISSSQEESRALADLGDYKTLPCVSVLKVISNSLFNISLWLFLLYILAQ